MGQHKIMPCLPLPCFQVKCPFWQLFAVRVRAVVALAAEHGMQLECAPNTFLLACA
jgi:hypothetical protein